MIGEPYQVCLLDTTSLDLGIKCDIGLHVFITNRALYQPPVFLSTPNFVDGYNLKT